MHYSSLFQYFLLMCYGSWKFQIFLRTCLLTFFETIIMTGKPMHTVSEIAPRTPAISIIVWKVKYPLRFIVSYVQPQHFESRTVRKAPLLSKKPLLKIQKISIMKGSHHVLLPNRHFSLSAKMNGTQRRTLVSPWRTHCMYCSMPKGTCWAEATSNSEKIKPVASAVIELHLSEGIGQSVSQPVENSVK